MASTYTTNLGIEKIGTGEQSGTWGDTTNTNFDILDEAINGIISVTLSSAGSSGSPTALPITDGASSNGRNKFIEFVDGGDLGGTAYVQLTPNNAEKVVHIRNSLSSSRSVIVFQGTYNASNDFEIVNGADVLLKFNGGGSGATVTDVNVDLTVTGATIATADINGGTIDGAVIGGASAAAGTFTTFTSTGIDDNATSTAIAIDSDGDIAITANGGGASNSADILVNSRAKFGYDGSRSAAIISDQATNKSIVFDTNNAERVRIDSSGNVGIRSSSPSGQFECSTGTGTAFFTRSAGDNGSTSSCLAVSTGASTTTIGATNPLTFNVGSTGTAANAQTERMRIDSSGNVGIGTTGVIDDSLSIAGDYNLSFAESTNSSYANIFRQASSAATVLANGYRRSGTSNKMESSIAVSWAKSAVWAGHESIRFYADAASADAVGTDLTPTERMRIKSSGNVGIGTTSPQSPLQLNKTPPTAFGSPFLSIGQATYTGSGMYTIAFGYEVGSGSNAPAEIGMVTTSDSSFTKGDLVFGTRDVVTDTAPSERARITSAGNLLVGCDAFGSVSTEGCQLGNNGTAIFSNDSDVPLYLNRTTSGVTTSQVVVSFFRNDVQSGTIGVSQGGTPAFGAPSDIRLKDNVADHKSELTNVMALRPVSWDWKDSSKGAGEGFVAQELEQTAWSDLVSDGEDGYKMVSGLGAVETRLIKALQEAVTRIETLEAEVAALKGE